MRDATAEKRYIASEIDKAMAVFLGEVVAADPLRARFKIEQVWKGELRGEITLRTGAREEGSLLISNTCDWNYKRGEEYLVFAYGSSLEDMKARKCTPTTTRARAEVTIGLMDEITRRGRDAEPLPSTRLQPAAPPGCSV